MLDLMFNVNTSIGLRFVFFNDRDFYLSLAIYFMKGKSPPSMSHAVLIWSVCMFIQTENKSLVVCGN